MKHTAMAVAGGVCVLAAVLSACGDAGPTEFAARSPAVTPDARSMVTPPIAEAPPPGVAIPPRLQGEIRVTGEFRPGHPLRIEFGGMMLEAADEAKLTLYLPQLSEAGGRSVRGERYSSASTEHRTAPMPSDRLAGQHVVAFSEEGMYHVQLISDAPTDGAGPNAPGRSVKDAWILILDDGGAVYSDFRTDVFPEGSVPGVGPLKRYMVGTPVLHGGGSGLLAALRAMAAPRSNTTFNVEYSYGGVDRPADGVEIEVALWDGYGQEYNGDWTYTVPSSGQVVVPCAQYGEELHGVVELPATSEVAGKTNVAFFTADHTDCGATVDVEVPAESYMPWLHLNTYIPVVDGITGYQRSPVQWSQYGEGGASYNATTDVIWFRDSYDSKGTAAHEYGHALHEESLGGTWEADCAGRITILSVTSEDCALVEGFAQYLGNAALGFQGYLETLQVASGDAAKIEANVASLFNDLLDAGNETGDQTTLSAYDVYTVFKTCMAGGVPRTRTADFAWCLEDRVNSTIHGTYFEPPVPSSVSSTRPGSWDSDAIRSTWQLAFGN